MSEFACALGHLVPPAEHFCPICRGRVAAIDGGRLMWYAEAELKDGKVVKVRQYVKEGDDEATI